VAIKILPGSWTHDRDRLRRFEQEARAAGTLNHPVLLTIYDVGEQDGIPYLVSELLEGETLRTRLRGGPLSPRRAMDYAIQIARGLAAAHEKGIVHRDVKPENIFITTDGRVKILDFGLTKLLSADASGSEATLGATEPGQVMGTAAYMSPEQVRGDSIDARSDIFAFGALLYEMLTGSHAFDGPSRVETMNAILTADAREVTNVAPALALIVSKPREAPTGALPVHRRSRVSSRTDQRDLGSGRPAWKAITSGDAIPDRSGARDRHRHRGRSSPQRRETHAVRFDRHCNPFSRCTSIRERDRPQGSRLPQRWFQRGADR
jgi:serine/threonine protein kinase